MESLGNGGVERRFLKFRQYRSELGPFDSMRLAPKIGHFSDFSHLRQGQTKKANQLPGQAFDFQFTPGTAGHGVDQHPSGQRIAGKAELLEIGKISAFFASPWRRGNSTA